MTARNGMSDLIKRLRALTDASTDEHTVAGVTYYSDAHLIERLDRQREDVYRQPLTAQVEYSGGTAIYRNYYFPTPDVERAESGSEAWLVEDYAGSAIGTANYTAHYDGQYIRFASNTEGSAYYLTYRAYDVDRAAAGIWREKASYVSSRPLRISTDNHTIDRGDLRKLYLDNAASFEKRAKPKAVRMVRDDAW